MHPRQRRILQSDALLFSLMRKQWRLSASCAGVFLGMLFALPLANFFWPDLMATRVGGFTLSWLILGLGFFPMVWTIAWVFIKRSIALEEQEVREVLADADEQTESEKTAA